MWQKLHNFFVRDDPTQSPIECPEDHDPWPQTWADALDSRTQDSSTRPLAVGLPRQTTFRRQNSERRDRLFPVETCHAERRAVSSTRQTSTSLPRPRARSSPPYWGSARTSAPAVAVTDKADAGIANAHVDAIPPLLDSSLPNETDEIWSHEHDRPPRPPSTTSSDDSYYPHLQAADDRSELRLELDSRWILNLSMHFRDRSEREKFFVTYAANPNSWRRVTVSCDYRNAEPGSLEMDLKELQFQRDKSMQIYESIRDSLPEIQFYDTVTNLKLETTDGRLHVHVTEDVNEIIPYPPRTTVAHILGDLEFRPMEVRESELTFDSHLSGFVYTVRYQGKVYIKKEIPGPDTVDEFLYEINALHALHSSEHVIQLEAIVVDDQRSSVRGLLISYAEKGAIVDLLYDHRGSIAWEDRCRWAEQAVRGLSNIHEEGYVQGDFTLSNIVVDGDGNARIIDINRRGCPVGWEPPEIATKIASNQRISMYIGEKSDLYQLGMTLWALAMDDDEPERHVSPLSVDEFPSEVPKWYQDVVRICLSSRPKDRLSAKDLIELFPVTAPRSYEQPEQQQRPALRLRTMKRYIDPADAVERDDIVRLGSTHLEPGNIPESPESSRDDYTFTYPKSSNYEFDSETSGYGRPRGRRLPINYSHLGRNERPHWMPDDGGSASFEDLEPNIVAISPGVEREFDEVELDGHPYLISRRTFNDEEMEILERSGETEGHSIGHVPNLGSLPDDTPESLGPPSPLPARRPSWAAAAVSATSESTPRNSHAVLPTLGIPQDFAFIPEQDGSDDAERSNGPSNLDDGKDYSQPDASSEGGVDLDRTTSNVVAQPQEGSKHLRLALDNSPPSLPFADSGFHELSDCAESDKIADPVIGRTSVRSIEPMSNKEKQSEALTSPDHELDHIEEDSSLPPAQEMVSAPRDLLEETYNSAKRDGSPLASSMEIEQPLSKEMPVLPAVDAAEGRSDAVLSSVKAKPDECDDADSSRAQLPVK